MELHSIEPEHVRASYPPNTPTPAAPVTDWSDQLAIIARMLAGHTSTPDDCWFAIWEGNTVLDDIRDSTPTAEINGYNYFLLRGPGSRVTDTYVGIAPNICWPADHSWCLVRHFDFPCVYFGGSQQSVTDLLRLPDIEAWPAHVDQVITADNDQLNSS